MSASERLKGVRATVNEYGPRSHTGSRLNWGCPKYVYKKKDLQQLQIIEKLKNHTTIRSTSK